MFADDETLVPLTLLPADTELPHERLLALFREREKLEDRIVDRVTRNPLESLVALLVSSSVGFYLAERETNPRIRTFWDALYYISTCASVGYADIFAQTQVGRTIASTVFTFGPALCAQVFDRSNGIQPTLKTAEGDQVVQKLEAILSELQKLNAR